MTSVPRRLSRAAVAKVPTIKRLRDKERWIKKTFDFQCGLDDFYTSSLQTETKLKMAYVVYRWVIFLCCLFSSLFTACDLQRDPDGNLRPFRYYLKYFIYLTNISMTLSTIKTAIGTAIVTRKVTKFRSQIPANRPVSWGLLLYWKLHELTTLVPLIVSGTYWLLLHHPKEHEFDASNFIAHGMNSVFTVVDWCVTGLPYSFSDYWMSMVFSFLYFVFTCIYWYGGGYPRAKPDQLVATSRVMYEKCTDWTKPTPLVICTVGNVAQLATLHLIFCALNRIRIRRILRRKSLKDVGITSNVILGREKQ